MDAETRSRLGRRSRRKGANYERKVKKWFEDKLGITLERTPQSGGFAKNRNLSRVKGDLNTLDDNVELLLHIECKDQKNWSLKSWWKQAIEECPPGKIPIVVYHQTQLNENGVRVQEADDFVMIRVKDFLQVLDKDQVIKLRRNNE